MTKEQIKLKLESLIHQVDNKFIPSPKGSIEQTIEYLSVCITYLLFDNEATRRELKSAIRKR